MKFYIVTWCDIVVRSKIFGSRKHAVDFAWEKVDQTGEKVEIMLFENGECTCRDAYY